MAKKFQIDLQLNTQQADAAAAKAAKEQEKIAAAAAKAAAAAEKAAERAAAASLKAAEREASQKQRIADRFLAAENSRGVAAERAKAAAADRAVRTAEQESAQKLRITDRFVAAEHRRMVDAERKKVALAEETARKAAEASAQAQERYTQVATGAALAIAAVVGQAFSGAVQAATDKQKEVSEKFKGTRTSLRELAQLSGRPLDDAFITDFAAQATKRGMTPTENAAFSTRVLGSAAQYIDTAEDPNRNMTSGMAESFVDKTALLSSARGLDPAVAADLAGVIMGTKKFKDVPGGPEAGVAEAFGLESQVFAILDAGRGEAKQLAEQYVKLHAASLTPEGVGSFKTPQDIATAVSLASQADPGRAFTGVQSSLRGMRDFGNPLIKAAGIKPTDEYFDAIRKLAPVLQAKADAMGGSIFDAANKTELNPEGFGDDMTARVIEIMIKEGVRKGLIEQRRGVARGASVEAAEAKIAAFQEGDEFQQAQVTGAGEEVDMRKGLGASKFTILRDKATARLRDSGDLDSTFSEFGKNIQAWASTFTGGIIPADRDQMKKDIEVLRMLKAAGADIPTDPSGLTGNLVFPGTAGYTNEGKQGFINEKIAELEFAGVKMSDIVRALDNNAAKTEENTRIMQSGFGGSAGGGDWALPSGAPPAAGAIR